MIRTASKWALCVALTGAMASAQAATLEGQRFDDTMVLSNQTLRLNGLWQVFTCPRRVKMRHRCCSHQVPSACA